MTKKSKGLFVAAAAFAASPQGRRLIQQAKEYASRPETKERAQQLLSQARSRGKGGSAAASPASENGSAARPDGTPPQP
jgi:hypothetical protein